MNSSDRVSWIDICRGIGIIFVIYSHGLNGESFRHIFYAFHMPLFFFLSGVVFHHRSYEHFTHFLKKSAKSILLPYFIFAFLSFFIWIINIKNVDVFSEPIVRQFLSIFYGNSNEKRLAFNVVLWFLPCLFVTRVGFATITKFVSDKRKILLIIFLLSIFGFLFSIFLPKVKLPFGAETAINGIVFFGAGYLWNMHIEKILTFVKKYGIFILFPSFLTLILIATIHYNVYGHQFDMRLNRLDNYVLFYGAAISGILSCILISKIIGKSPVLQFIGKYSLVLFIWHLIVFSYISQVLRNFITPQTINELRNIYFAPLYTILSIIIILSFTILIQKLKSYIFVFTSKSR